MRWSLNIPSLHVACRTRLLLLCSKLFPPLPGPLVLQLSPAGRGRVWLVYSKHNEHTLSTISSTFPACTASGLMTITVNCLGVGSVQKLLSSCVPRAAMYANYLASLAPPALTPAHPPPTLPPQHSVPHPQTG